MDYKDRRTVSAYCSDCGAWFGPLGMEPDPDLFADHLTLIFEEVRRVLRPDGVFWLNMGDSYNASGGAGGDYNKGGHRAGQPRYGRKDAPGLKPKDLVMMPARVALALQRAGWWVRCQTLRS